MMPTVKRSHEALPILNTFAGVLKKFRMYEVGHPALEQSIDMLKLRFDEFFKLFPKLSIGIANDRMYIDDAEIAGQDWIKSLVRELHERSVNHLVFHQTLQRQEIISFLSTLFSDPLWIRNNGGYKIVLSSYGVTSIVASEIEYRIHEDEIRQQLATLSDAEIWRRIAQDWKVEREQLSPTDLLFINALIDDVPRLSYLLDSAIVEKMKGKGGVEAADNFFQLLSIMIPDPQSDGPYIADTFKDQVKRILTSINPISFYTLLNKASQDRFLYAPRKALVRDILFDVSSKTISRGLFEGLDPQRSKIQDFCQTYAQFVTPKRENTILTEMKNSLQDHYAKEEAHYQQLLERIDQLPSEPAPIRRVRETLRESHRAIALREAPIADFLGQYSQDVKDMIGTLTEHHIDQEACGNLLSVMEVVSNSESYVLYAQGFGDSLLQLLETGQYEMAEKAVRLLRQHASLKNNFENSRNIARKVLNTIRKPKIAEDLLRALSTWGKKESRAISNLLLSLGPVAYEATLQALNIEENRAIRSVMIEVLAKSGEHGTELIRDHLNSPNWFVVRNMISLLSRIQPPELVDCLLKTGQHSEPRVRKETARALSGISDSRAVLLLIRLLQDPDSTVRHQAILSLGQLSQNEQAARALLKLLQEKAPFEGDIEAEKITLQSLARIKHPIALPVICRYVTETGFFSRPDEKVIEAAINAVSALGDLETLKSGAKSWNKTVRQYCQKCLETHERK